MLTEDDLKAIDQHWEEACWAINRRHDGQPFSIRAIVESASDVPLLYDMIRDLQARLEDREAKIEAVRDAVRRHRDERGDDRCWMDDERLYDEALPEGCQDRGNRVDRRLHCPEEMMRHCQQFIQSRQPEGEPYVSPQREIDRLRAENDLHEECRDCEDREIHKTLKRACETLGKPWRKSKDWPTLYGAVTPSICVDDVLRAFESEVQRLRAALAKINDIRNSIVGLQTINWSEHVYPLVMVLDEVGLKGMPYPDAKKQYGTMLDRATAAEAEIDRLRAALERIACRDQGEVGPHMEEPRSAAIAREVLG